MDCLGGQQCALVASKSPNGGRVAQVQKRRECPKRPGAVDIQLLFDRKHMDGREISLRRFGRIDERER
jgi:hypothetical protein